MDVETSGRLLLAHAGEVPGDPRGEEGFLGSLRPYRGIREENFVEVMTALHGLRNVLRGDLVPRVYVGALWTLCDTARVEGLSSRSALQRDKLMSPADTERLSRWLRTIEVTVRFLLGGKPDGVAFFGVVRLVAERRVVATAEPWTQIACLVLEEEVDDLAPEDHVTAIQALSVLGGEGARGAVERAFKSSNSVVRAAAKAALRAWGLDGG
ncbi:MAG: hypothetical protein KF878_22330 [Planctomycetes bacterium]|nr:hypothetical protein [Planctomycetota bacterium]